MSTDEYSGSSRSGSGTCHKCGFLSWVNLSPYPMTPEGFDENRRRVYRKARCTKCGGSGWDSKGKPCRRCS